MKRRSFLKNVLPLGLAPFALNGIPVRAMARSLMTSSFSCADVGDRVLVLIQLHGGNDGLNTLIPLDQYNTYRNLRPTIGVLETGARQYLTLDQTLPSNQQIGLHPDLEPIKQLYDDGQVAFVQDVSYDHANGSHFRGTDTWLSGLDNDSMPVSPDSGWWGRYLDRRFPNYPTGFPNNDMPDPPGLEFGSHVVSLGFHRQTGIPMGLSLSNDPTDFYNSISGVGGPLPANFPASDYGRELEYLVQMEQSTNEYAQRLTSVYSQGANTPGVVYPDTYHTNTTSQYNNRLSPQLKAVARLLSGGIKSKVFLVRLTGFDTHEGQGIPDKPSFGSHSALLYHIAAAVKAFQDDLAGLGLADRVLTLTFSEFGRTVAENGTYGTDHGTSAPMMIFGRGIKPGVIGANPNLSQVNNNRLVGFQYDYRQVFATVLQDWFGANYGTLEHAEFYEFGSQKVPLINDSYVDPQGQLINYVADPSCDPTQDLPPPPITAVDPGLAARLRFRLWPNPARERVHFQLSLDEASPAILSLYDANGKRVLGQDLRLYAGENTVPVDLPALSAGVYTLRIHLRRSPVLGQPLLASEKLVIR